MAVTGPSYGYRMELLLGLIFWGGLLMLTLAWLARIGSSGHRTDSSARPSSRSMPPPLPGSSSRVRKLEDQRLREDEALADGLVIGHFLTRDHYQRRIGHLEGHVDELAEDRDGWLEAAAAGDDLYDELDYAEFDGLGGFGVEPWADDLFDVDDED